MNAHNWLTELSVRFGGPICVIVPNFAKIGRNVADVGISELGKKDRSLQIYKNGYLGRLGVT